MKKIGLLGAFALFSAAPLAAQGFRTGTIDPEQRTGTIRLPGGVIVGQDADTSRGHQSNHIPRGHLPPAGMCRVWIDGVPPGQQPAPTDCQTAVATKPANARVIFGGDGTSFPGKGKGKLKSAGTGNRQPGTAIGRGKGHDRGDGLGRGRAENRGKGKSLAKRGKKG